MLPLYALPPCPRCRFEDQGTRAKAGKGTRCWNCGVWRKVPVARPAAGPDAPHAIRPERGRPFQPGNPYRFTSEQESYS